MVRNSDLNTLCIKSNYFISFTNQIKKRTNKQTNNGAGEKGEVREVGEGDMREVTETLTHYGAGDQRGMRDVRPKLAWETKWRWRVVTMRKRNPLILECLLFLEI